MRIDKISMFVKNLWTYKAIVFSKFLKSLGVLFSIEKLLELLDTGECLKTHSFILGVVLLIASAFGGISFLLFKKKKIQLSLINERNSQPIMVTYLMNRAYE